MQEVVIVTNGTCVRCMLTPDQLREVLQTHQYILFYGEPPVVLHVGDLARYLAGPQARA